MSVAQREFALEVVESLRKAGFQALWAGGCVRDELLGRQPKDYDVATNATPDQIRGVFGRRKTLAIGAAFGVITVLGPRGAGQIEVATFRRDAAYSDGRHPDSVTFCDPREDATRRDFTINGLFYDSIEKKVIDYVGGQEDLGRRLIRAIGDPDERFNEDKLRMLRAVRFAATFDYQLEETTFEAISRRAGEIITVSPERISMEMRRILEDRRRARGVRLLVQTGLAAVILPEITPPRCSFLSEGEEGDVLAVIEKLDEAGFPLVLAAILHRRVDSEGARRVALRWRLSNKEADRLAWLVEHHAGLDGAREKPWSQLQPLVIDEGIGDLVALAEAKRRAAGGDLAELAWVRSVAARPRDQLDPPPLVTGEDLIRRGVSRGPIYKDILDRVRRAQIDGEVRSKEEALERVGRFVQSGEW